MESLKMHEANEGSMHDPLFFSGAGNSGGAGGGAAFPVTSPASPPPSAKVNVGIGLDRAAAGGCKDSRLAAVHNVRAIQKIMKDRSDKPMQLHYRASKAQTPATMQALSIAGAELRRTRRGQVIARLGWEEDHASERTEGDSCSTRGSSSMSGCRLLSERTALASFAEDEEESTSTVATGSENSGVGWTRPHSVGANPDTSGSPLPMWPPRPASAATFTPWFDTDPPSPSSATDSSMYCYRKPSGESFNFEHVDQATMGGKYSCLTGTVVGSPSGMSHRTPPQRCSQARLTEVPRLRNRFRDQSAILHSSFDRGVATLKRLNHATARSLDLRSEDWDASRVYSYNVDDLERLAQCAKLRRSREQFMAMVQEWHSAVTIQHNWRAMRTRQKEPKAAVKRLVRWWRIITRFVLPLHRHVSARRIQRAWRRSVVNRRRRVHATLRSVCTDLDLLLCSLGPTEEQAALRLQRRVRRHLVIQRWRRRMRSILLIQAALRGHFARVRASQLCFARRRLAAWPRYRSAANRSRWQSTGAERGRWLTSSKTPSSGRSNAAQQRMKAPSPLPPFTSSPQRRRSCGAADEPLRVSPSRRRSSVSGGQSSMEAERIAKGSRPRRDSMSSKCMHRVRRRASDATPQEQVRAER
eukprot:NODE_860_length_2730_cov_4.295044.p1 GENE.NODE_860_length_2730_cov_4.295044~~NODE_860_length_2730_cov_4.295044.p1  ORF type:complete len:696 (-),score=149.00 NODE_860_length_2730_cov_4.295044:641-2563(-)